MPEHPAEKVPKTKSIRVIVLLCLGATGIYLILFRTPGPAVQGQFQGPIPAKITLASFQQPDVGRDCMRGCHNAIVEAFALEVHGKSAKFLSDSRAANC